MTDDDEEPIQKAVETVTRLDFGTTSNGNDKVTIYTESGQSYWLFKDDWLDELDLREDDYLGTSMEIYYRDANGDGSFLIAEYLWPADPFHQESWFARYLKSRGLLSELSDNYSSGDRERLRDKVKEIYD